MKKIFLLLVAVFCCLLVTNAQTSSYYETSITFPKDYKVGDYVSFVWAEAHGSGAGGYYEVSLTCLRGNMAAGATHLYSSSHANPQIWREAGRINDNPYSVSSAKAFTVDVKTNASASEIRVRATAVQGVLDQDMVVNVKVRAIGITSTFTPLSRIGTETASSIPLAPMTAEWNLWVGNPFFSEPAKVAIKADVNGNVGIGTLSPAEKLSVNGTVLAKKVKVTATGWPDYVFAQNYALPSLQEVEKYIGEHQHLPGVPSAAEVEREKVDLGAMNEILLRKIEELTLYLIEERKEREVLKAEVEKLRKAQTDK
ncbi:hypothetical protein SAMN05444266_101151 [Chitinophaga jiangningensis]|uniref:Uncharacterized protein n=1 Tax=Chitinophaga jiangningensis TaxID=1419482 RepID=A0A1M6VC04_9BACT|nr:hypothetical protein [Chitinophaga jiangningensis]SHK79022.1 hypothetical protein SAMN05444266_101151 [Chitinophaga jiangningensis]